MTVCSNNIPSAPLLCCLALLSCGGTLDLHLPERTVLQERAFDLQRVRQTRFAGNGSQVLSAGPSIVGVDDSSPIFSGGANFIPTSQCTELIGAGFRWEPVQPAKSDLANDLRQIAVDMPVREVAGLLGVSHTAFYGWLRGEQIAPERQIAIRSLSLALTEIRTVLRGANLRKALTVTNALGLTAADLLKAGEFDAAVGAVSMFPIEGASIAPIGVGMELPVAVNVPHWEGAVSSPMSESPAVLELLDTQYYEMPDDQAVVLSAISVG
jgi:hypothetical protein